MISSQELLKKTVELISKINRLTAKEAKLISTLKTRDDKIEKMRKEAITYEERIQVLEQEVASLKLGGLIDLSDSGRKEVKQKLNVYIRELDDVIAKLSSEE